MESNDSNDPCDILYWSQVIFHVWETLAQRELEQITQLRTIWRYLIINGDTREIIGQSKDHGHPRSEKSAFFEYRPPSASGVLAFRKDTLRHLVGLCSGSGLYL